MLGKETYQYSHRQSSKNTLCKCILERETQETVFGKTNGSDIPSCICCKKLWLSICSKCGFLKQMLVKKTLSVEAGFKTTYIRRRDKTRQVPSKTMKIEKQADKQVSVEARDNRRNTTDVPTNFMFPACGNNIVLLGKKSKCGCPEENVVREKYKRRFTSAN